MDQHGLDSPHTCRERSTENPDERSETEVVAGACRSEEDVVGDHPAGIAEEETTSGMARLELSR